MKCDTQKSRWKASLVFAQHSEPKGHLSCEAQFQRIFGIRTELHKCVYHTVFYFLQFTFYLFYIFYHSVTVVLISPPLLSPAPSNPCSQIQSPPHCIVHGSFLHVFPPLSPSSLPSCSCLFFISVSVVLFCSFVGFVD